MTDVTGEIDAVRRMVGSRTLEAGEARVVTVTRVYATDLEDLWDAVTNPERLPRWFLPVSGDLRPGGRYALEGNASGTVGSCEPPRAFTATWEHGGDVSSIEVRLTAEDAARTRFELQHIARVEDERWAQFGPGAVGVGWELALMGLEWHVATGGANDPAQAAAWAASQDGTRFITLCSEAWGEASAAAGADADAAREAAERTTAFYTGAPAA
jgi:uncharacterized protein YndB with AHSA1/START domain